MMEHKYITMGDSCSVLSWSDQSVGYREDYLVCTK